MGSEPGGITQSVGWIGGGRFSVLEVSPSLWDQRRDSAQYSTVTEVEPEHNEGKDSHVA